MADRGQDPPVERQQLIKKYEDEQGDSQGEYYAVRDRKYVLADNDAQTSCDCCTSECRYFNFFKCQETEEDQEVDLECMEDFNSWISICTNQFSEFDRFTRGCDGLPAQWWFRVRFEEPGEGEDNLSGTGCYSGVIILPDDPEVPPGTAFPRGQIVYREPLQYEYCTSSCGWARGSVTVGGLPRLIDEKTDHCHADAWDGTGCQKGCGWWELEGDSLDDHCEECCKEACWYQDYERCSTDETEGGPCAGKRPGISVVCLCSTDQDVLYGDEAPENCRQCCPEDTCGFNNAGCMPMFIKDDSCCYKRVGSLTEGELYLVRPYPPYDETPNYQPMDLGDPCLINSPWVRIETCDDYVDGQPERSCRLPEEEMFMCMGCYTECTPPGGPTQWCPRNTALITFETEARNNSCGTEPLTGQSCLACCGPNPPGHCCQDINGDFCCYHGYWHAANHQFTVAAGFKEFASGNGTIRYWEGIKWFSGYYNELPADRFVGFPWYWHGAPAGTPCIDYPIYSPFTAIGIRVVMWDEVSGEWSPGGHSGWTPSEYFTAHPKECVGCSWAFTAGCLSDAPWFTLDMLEPYKPCCDPNLWGEDYCKVNSPCDVCDGAESWNCDQNCKYGIGYGIACQFGPGDICGYSDLPPWDPCYQTQNQGPFNVSPGFCHPYWPGDGGYAAQHGTDLWGCGEDQDCMNLRRTGRFVAYAELVIGSQHGDCECGVNYPGCGFCAKHNGSYYRGGSVLSCTDLECSLTPVEQSQKMFWNSRPGGFCRDLVSMVSCDGCGLPNNPCFPCSTLQANSGSIKITGAELVHISLGEEDEPGCGDNCFTYDPP
jgi:hypothetical protein